MSFLVLTFAVVLSRSRLGSKNQYRERLKRWRDPVNQQSANIIRTNITAQEWKYIVERIDERQSVGKSSLVTVRGFEVPQSRVKKQGRVHSYKSTLEKLAPSTFNEPYFSYQLADNNLETCLTELPDIVVSTPLERSLTPAMNQRYIEFSLYFERLPWRVFTDHLNATMRLAGGIDSVSGHPLGFLSLANQVPMDLMDLGTELNVFGARSQSYLPPSDVIASTTGSDSCFSLVTKATPLDLLKYIVGIVSNCHDDNNMIEELQILLQIESNLKFLSRLFTMKGVAIKAFLEKILPISLSNPLEIPDISVIRVLLDTGASLNGQDNEGFSGLDLALIWLSYFPEENIGAIVLELLNRGATPCSPKLYSRISDTYCKIMPSPLDLLIIYANEHTLQSLMESSLMVQRDRDITLGTFVITVHLGHIELFQKLSTFQPMIVEQLRKSPWFLFEAAAFGCKLPMIKYLQEVGFDITLTDSFGCGNPLVFAFRSYTDEPEMKSELIQYLLDLGIFIHWYGNGAMLDFLKQPFNLHEMNDIIENPDEPRAVIGVIFHKNTKKITPIHAATVFSEVSQIMNLLERGANPNQHGAVYPIQLSVLSNDYQVARVLLKAGADPNLTTQPSPRQGNGQASRNMPECCYQTALLIAIQYSNPETVQMLQTAGAYFPIPPPCTYSHKESSLDGGDWDLVSPIITVLGESETSQEITHVPPHHDINNDLCACNDEYQWNLLLLAGSEDIFSFLLGEAPMWLRDHWASRSCFLRTIQDFGWRFTLHHIRIGTFPTLCIDKEELLLEAIRNEDDQWSCYLVDLPYQSLLRGFVIATSLCQTRTTQKLLGKGVWPDDSALVQLRRNGEIALYSPLGRILSSKNDEMRNIIVQHYKKIVHVADSNNSLHLEQAYSIAVRYGCIELAELVKVNRDIDNAKYTGLRFDPEGYILDSPKMVIRSAVHIASAFNQVDTAIWLLNQGADPNISYDALTDPLRYHSPLQCAAKHEQTALIIALLAKGARVNDHTINAKGATALQFAALLGNFEMLEVLLEAGADINASASKYDGRTAIEGAAEQGRLDMVSFLMEAGANIQGRKNVNYRRTVYRAWVHGHRVLAEMVQQWKSERYGPEDCEPTKSIIRSMDMATLGCAEQDRLELPDSSMEYYDPCQVCKVECIRDGYSESCEDEWGWDGDSE